MNNSCVLAENEVDSVRYIDTAISVSTVLVAPLAIVMTVCFGLCKQLSYRLAVYQIVAAFLRGSVNALQILFINYDRNPSVYGPLCVTVSTILQSASWAELLFATWVTFHLFCFSVFYRNLKKLEILYVSSTLIVSLVLSLIPVATKSYGKGEDGGCWFLHTINGGEIERYVLWSVPVLVVLIGNTLGVVTLVTVVVCRLKAGKYRTVGSQHRKALRQMLPLLAYPVICCLLFLPTVTKTSYNISHCPNYALSILNSVCSDGWSFVSCLILLGQVGCTEATKCAHKETAAVKILRPTPSYTYYSFPTDSCCETIQNS